MGLSGNDRGIEVRDVPGVAQPWAGPENTAEEGVPVKESPLEDRLQPVLGGATSAWGWRSPCTTGSASGGEEGGESALGCIGSGLGSSPACLRALTPSITRGQPHSSSQRSSPCPFRSKNLKVIPFPDVNLASRPDRNQLDWTGPQRACRGSHGVCPLTPHPGGCSFTPRRKAAP